LSYETLETFEAPEGLSEVTFATKVDVGCPYRERGRDEYEVTIGYGPRTLCAAAGSLEEFVKGYENATVSGEELAAQIGDRVGEELDPRFVRVELRLLNAPFELNARAERSHGTGEEREKATSRRLSRAPE
jgi:NADPH-dependent 7-cyano-7-deazaguanine reductase QueF